MVRAIVAVLLPLAGATTARAESLVVSLSVTQVAVTSTFAGTSIVIFGAVERDAQTVARGAPYDIVATVRGPRQSLTVREKEQLGPIWVNRAQQKFAEVPSFLAVLASRPLTEVAGERSRRQLRIGLDAIVAAPDLTLSRDRTDDPFRAALLRLRAGQRLFVENEAAVTFLSPSLFRATIALPAIAPVGRYDVAVALFSGGAVLARHETQFSLAKSGIEQRLAGFAHDWSLLYGLAMGVFALSFGWIASVIFRRD